MRSGLESESAAGRDGRALLRQHLTKSPICRGNSAVIAAEIAATRLDGATDLYQIDLRAPLAWVFGAEGQGVSPEVARCAALGVHIPMQPGIESLNVAAAAAICLFEQRRQRTESISG